MSFYENLVMQTQMNYQQYYSVYASGRTPYALSEKKPLSYQEQISRLVHEIREADCILVGGASGLSAAGGGDFYYEDNASFHKYFGKFAEKYHFKGAFDGMMRQWDDRTAFWAYLATFLHTTQTAPVREPYLNLDALLQGKDFFILTTNQDTQFVKLYPEDKVAEIQGDHRFFQCAVCCTDDTWDAVKPVEKMMSAMGDDITIPENLIPRCPHCGSPLTVNIADSNSFFQTGHFQKKMKDYQNFIQKYHGKNLVILELGIGWRNRMIKEPLMQLTASEPHAFYITFNKGEIYIPSGIAGKSVGMDGDIADMLERILG